MLKSFRVFALTLALMLMTSVPAFAGAQDFVLVNNTGSTIVNVFVSPVNSSDWKEYVLGETGTVAPGDSATIRFNDADNRQYWDLRIIFDNGADYVFDDIDIFVINQITVFSNGTSIYQ